MRTVPDSGTYICWDDGDDDKASILADAHLVAYGSEMWSLTIGLLMR